MWEIATLRCAPFSMTYGEETFLDSLNGWAVGFHEILRTKDSGVTWDTVYYDVTEDIYFGSIDFIDSANGWAAANNGRVLRTNNSGINWDTTTIEMGNVYTSYFEDINFIDSNNGILIGAWGDNFFNSHSLIYKTTDSPRHLTEAVFLLPHLPVIARTGLDFCNFGW